MHVIIVGAGIAGLTTAIALKHHGVDVTVVEKAPALGEVGAGIQLSANGVQILRRLGLGDVLADTAVYPETWQNLDLETGEVLLEFPLGERAEQLYGHPFYHMHRADLLDALAKAVPADVLRLDSRCVRIDQDDSGVRVTLSSGAEIDADALIGADGIRSFVREQLHGPANPTFAGTHGWRGLVKADRLHGVGLEHRTYIWTGRGRNIVGYWVRGGELFNLLAIVPGADEQRESWLTMSTVENFLQVVEGAEERILRAAEAVEEPFITGMFFRDPLPSWCHGRAGLVGDAAHPMVPHLAQGACQSIEDAWVAAACLARHGSRQVPQALAEYEQRRRPRTTKIQASARDAARLYHLEDPVEVGRRNARWRGLSKIDPDRRSFWEWVYGYSALDATAQPAGDVFGIPSARMGHRMARPLAQRAADAYSSIFGPDDIARGFTGMREAYDRFLIEGFPLHARVETSEVQAGAVPGYWVRSGCEVHRAQDEVTLLHLHGGGLVMGSARASLELSARLAAAARGRVLTVDYRLAPEHPYPAALDDALAAYRWLLDAGVPAAQIVLTGESAGGGLALSAVHALKLAGDPLPGGVVVLSPVTDHTVAGESVTAYHGQDPLVDRDRLIHFAAAYIQDHNPRDPLVSPLFGDLSGFPPLLVQAVRGEVLESDSFRLADAAKKAGTAVTLDLYEDSVHVFPTFAYLPETELALQRLAAFVDQHVRGAEMADPRPRSETSNV